MHMYTNTCSAVASDTEKGRIGRFLSVCTAQTSSNPFQDFLIEELQSLVVFLNTDTQTPVERQQKPHINLYPLSLSSRTASEKETCFLFMMRTHQVPMFTGTFHRMWPRSRGLRLWVQWRKDGEVGLYIGSPDRIYQATGASLSITCTMEIAKGTYFSVVLLTR